MPTSEAFRIELRSQLRQAALRGVLYVDINSGDLHRKLGGYPGPYHVMPSCCKIMYDEQWDGDQIRSSPQKGFGASLTIRYKLPRWKDRAMPRGPKGEKRPADVIGAAVMVAKIATGEIDDNPSPTPARAKGGKIGGKRRASKLTPEQRSAIAETAAKARWGKSQTHRD